MLSSNSSTYEKVFVLFFLLLYSLKLNLKTSSRTIISYCSSFLRCKKANVWQNHHYLQAKIGLRNEPFAEKVTFYDLHVIIVENFSAHRRKSYLMFVYPYIITESQKLTTTKHAKFLRELLAVIFTSCNKQQLGMKKLPGRDN